MPSLDHCSACNKQVQRTPTSAVKIICHACRTKNRCGTPAGYYAGCRCRPCKDAKAAQMREYSARRKAQGRPLPRSNWRAYEDLTCDCCQETFTREKRNDPRYARAFCSLLCRDYTLHGPRIKKLPKDHMVFWINQSCDWQPPHPPGPYPFTCEWCETQGESDYPTTTYCDEQCRARARRMRRRGREFEAHGTYTWGQVVHLWVGFHKACAYCQQPTALTDIQAEHVIALSNGGANNVGNILPSCGPCNADKRDLTLDAWKADRERRALPPVVTHWEADDPKYQHLTLRGYRLAA